MAIQGVDLTGGRIRILVDRDIIDLSASEKVQAKTSEGLREVLAARTGKAIAGGVYVHTVPGGYEYVVIAEREPDWAKFDSENGRVSR